MRVPGFQLLGYKGCLQKRDSTNLNCKRGRLLFEPRALGPFEAPALILALLSPGSGGAAGDPEEGVHTGSSLGGCYSLVFLTAVITMLMAKIACLAFSTPQLSELWHMPALRITIRPGCCPQATIGGIFRGSPESEGRGVGRRQRARRAPGHSPGVLKGMMQAWLLWDFRCGKVCFLCCPV